jgi:3-hydroxyisobutyrate dehydrogenase-like beta-hydroxyacid dehydrogenase
MTRCDLRVGVIGLGALGLPMAANLKRADVPLRVHTRSRSAERDPSLQGSIACATPAEVAQAWTFC